MYWLLYICKKENLLEIKVNLFKICIFFHYFCHVCEFASLVAQTVKCLPTMRVTQVQSLGWEDLLEKERTTRSSPLAWKIPWMEEPGRLQSMGSQRVGRDWETSVTHFMWICKMFLNLQALKKYIWSTVQEDGKHIRRERVSSITISNRIK